MGIFEPIGKDFEVVFYKTDVFGLTRPKLPGPIIEGAIAFQSEQE